MTKCNFTIDEAQALIPWLKERFQVIHSMLADIKELSNKTQRLELESRSNGSSEKGKELDSSNKTIIDFSKTIEEHVRIIVDRGILVKSVEDGLVDFPSSREGRNVYLCWRVGENEIGFWHDIDAGFSGRQPL